MAKPRTPKKDDVLITPIYGNQTKVRVLSVKMFGTMDVMRLSDGCCFRLTGLGWIFA